MSGHTGKQAGREADVCEVNRTCGSASHQISLSCVVSGHTAKQAGREADVCEVNWTCGSASHLRSS